MHVKIFYVHMLCSDNHGYEYLAENINNVCGIPQSQNEKARGEYNMFGVS